MSQTKLAVFNEEEHSSCNQREHFEHCIQFSPDKESCHHSPQIMHSQSTSLRFYSLSPPEIFGNLVGKLIIDFLLMLTIDFNFFAFCLVVTFLLGCFLGFFTLSLLFLIASNNLFLYGDAVMISDSCRFKSFGFKFP